MTHFVTEACIACRYTDCVSVCPVDCFRVGPNFLVIDPDGCIDCGVCIPECPVDAIRADNDRRPGEEGFLALNEELSRLWPEISEAADPLPSAEAFKERSGKLELLIR